MRKINEFYTRLQDDHYLWRNRNFKDEAQRAKPHRQLLGMIEEIGELQECLDATACSWAAHAGNETIVVHAGTEKKTMTRKAAVADCVADLIIFCAGYCNDHDLCLAEIMQNAAVLARRRNYPPVYEKYMLLYAGRLCHHHLKNEQRIRGSCMDHKVQILKSCTYLIAGALNLAWSLDIDTHMAVKETWEGTDDEPGVRDRDWVAHRAQQDAAEGISI